MSLYKRKKRRGIIIPFASQADIAFLLLIFFMLSYDYQVPLEYTNIPKANTIASENDLNIYVTSSGELHFMEREVYDINTLVTLLKIESSKNPPPDKVLLHGDSKARFKYVYDVYDSLKEAGIKTVYLVAREEIKKK